MSTIPITKRGAEKLKAELHQLKTVERPGVVNAIAEARAQGDLSENAEYDAAKDRQGFVEGSGTQVSYQIVGEDEADIKLGLVNIGSPIARALIGKSVGDTATVQAPGGVKTYEIMSVAYI